MRLEANNPPQQPQGLAGLCEEDRAQKTQGLNRSICDPGVNLPGRWDAQSLSLYYLFPCLAQCMAQNWSSTRVNCMGDGTRNYF